MSKAAKKTLFKTGEICVICATDAAGMGCNVSDVKYVVSFGIPKSVSTVLNAGVAQAVAEQRMVYAYFWC